MENKEYQYTEDPFNVSRRQFITISGIVVALLALPAVWVKTIVSSNNDYILARTKGLYNDDEKAKIRVSHANKAVAQYYKDFGGKPLGELSEELLHTKYVNRTKGLS
jgi:ferredoxin hydrogenase small subunit